MRVKATYVMSGVALASAIVCAGAGNYLASWFAFTTSYYSLMFARGLKNA